MDGPCLGFFFLFALFGREPESTPGRNLYMQIYMYTHIPIHRYAYIHIYIFMREGGREGGKSIAEAPNRDLSQKAIRPE